MYVTSLLPRGRYIVITIVVVQHDLVLPDSEVVSEVGFSFNDYKILLCNCKYCTFIRYFLSYLYCGEYKSFIGSPLSLVNIIHLLQLTTTYCVVTAVETAISLEKIPYRLVK